MLYRRPGARVWRFERREQSPHVGEGSELLGSTASLAPCIEELRKQRLHRRPFIYEEADVALELGECKGSFERGQCVTRVVLGLQGKRAQGDDLDDAPHPPSVLSRPKQPTE